MGRYGRLILPTVLFRVSIKSTDIFVTIKRMYIVGKYYTQLYELKKQEEARASGELFLQVRGKYK